METIPRPRGPDQEQAQPDIPWHGQSVEAVVAAQNTDIEQGLSSQEASQRLGQYGLNQLVLSRRRSKLRLISEQFITWPVALLSTAALVSLTTGSPIDAVVIMGVVVINAVIGYVTESQSERIIQSLQGDDQPMAQVLRDGLVQPLEASQIVPGDVLLLQPGKTVAADARIVKADNLTIDESALTGESLTVTKQPLPLPAETPLADRVNQVFKGTLVTSGRGRGVVVSTGQQTEIGQIQALVGSTAAVETPLQGQLATVSGQLVLLCSGVCAAIFAVGTLRGYGVLHGLKTAISLAVAAVPEGLPAVATTTLALGIQTMRRRKILIRALNAVEALGAVQVVCLDKTGTLTRNQMAVQQVALATGLLTLQDGHFLDSAGNRVEPGGQPALVKLLEIGVLCSDSEVLPQGEEAAQIQGSPTENALIHMALGANLDVLGLRLRYPTQKVNPRSENRNLMSTLHTTPEGNELVAVKGSPTEVLHRCTRRLAGGDILPLEAADRQQLDQANHHMADQALRVLALAYRELPPEEPDGDHDLIWLGLVGLADPIRQGMPELMADFHRAGIKTVMLTGDQSSTARAIGQQLNLSRHGDLTVVEARELAALQGNALEDLAHRVDIFARISPADKLNIVRALQAAHKVVAMTGDGINDTPALKAANIGLAMGSGKSQGVHDVADVVILEDNLSTLIDAVSQGRTIYTNIRKAVHFLLATNLSEIMVVAIATLVGLGEPLNAIQLLWLNLVTDIFPGLGLALEPPEPNVLDHPPRSPAERIIKTSDFKRITWEAGVISASALAAYGYALHRYGPGLQSSTVAFMGLTIAQVLHTFSCRSESHRWFDPKPLPRNGYVEAAIAGALALQLLPLIFPALGQLLKITPLNGRDYLVIAIAALVPLLINELTKTSPSSSPDPDNAGAKVKPPEES